MIDSIPLTQVDPSLVISKALTLYDGTVASGGSRFRVTFAPRARDIETGA